MNIKNMREGVDWDNEMVNTIDWTIDNIINKIKNRV